MIQAWKKLVFWKNESLSSTRKKFYISYIQFLSSYIIHTFYTQISVINFLNSDFKFHQFWAVFESFLSSFSVVCEQFSFLGSFVVVFEQFSLLSSFLVVFEQYSLLSSLQYSHLSSFRFWAVSKGKKIKLLKNEHCSNTTKCKTAQKRKLLKSGQPCRYKFSYP